MSSLPATAQDGIPRSAGAPIRHPLALTALGLAFLAATLGAFGLGSRLTSSSAAESKGSRLAAGSLALLHARLEQQALMASLLSSGSEELSTLTAEVTALETNLNKIVSEVKTKKDEFDKLTEQIPFYDVRHSVKPGVTGWAQCRYAYGASVEDGMVKLQYDLYYVKNHSLFLDLLILVETLQVVLLGKGAR